VQTLPSRYQLILSGAAFLVLVGCQTASMQQSNPGLLPSPLATDHERRINASTYFAHGHLLERQFQLERAVVQYRKALRGHPDFVAALNRLGITLNKLDRHAEAAEQFQLAIAKQPTTAHLHNNLGFSLYLEGRYEDAATALQAALALQPQYARARINHALVLAKLTRFDEAFTELNEACGQADAYFNMGVMLTEAERYAEAAHYLEAALEARPTFEAARVQLHEVSRLAAEWDARQASLALAAGQEQARSDEDAEQNIADDVGDAPVTPSGETLAAAPPAPIDESTPEIATAATPIQASDPSPAASEAPPSNLDGDPCDDAEVDIVSVLWQHDEEWLAGITGGEDWSWLQTSVLDAPWSDAAETFAADDPPAPAKRASESGVDQRLLVSMIDAAVWAWRQDQWDEFDALWCELGYYLFPETAPGEPATDQTWLADQRDFEFLSEQPLAK